MPCHQPKLAPKPLSPKGCSGRPEQPLYWSACIWCLKQAQEAALGLGKCVEGEKLLAALRCSAAGAAHRV